MARINIEDSLYKDIRFLKLYAALGSMEQALGALVRVWTVAQQFYLHDDRKIPLDAWVQNELNDKVIECGLATVENGRISVAGADEQFKWLLQRSEAGKKGGKSSKNSSNRSLTAEDGRTTTANGSNPLTLSLTLSPKEKERYILETDLRPSDIPTSLTKEPENEEAKKLAKEKKRDGALKIQEIWNQERKHLPECVILTSKRESSAAKRWDDFPSEEFWRETIRKALQSDFLSGRSGKFKATFDFLMRPDTAVKINEGAYDSNKPKISVRM